MTKFAEGRMSGVFRSRMLLIGIGVITMGAFVLLVVMLVGKLDAAPQRTESYKDVSGAAGLLATIDYSCPGACSQKYDFNVLVFAESGQQVATLRPDNKGHLNAALPQGEYLLLIAKQFGNSKLFPEEHILLKNGKQLELKLQYGRAS